jgi:hypothetical protein
MPLSSADPNAFVAIGLQSALGTPQITAGKLLFAKYESGTDFQPQIEVVDLREGGDGLDYGFTYKKSQKAAGQIVINGRPMILPQLLAAVPAGGTWDGGSLMAKHTFQSNHASFPWFTIVAAHPGTNPQLFSDVRFTGVTIEVSPGDPWKFTFPFTAINHGASSGAFTPTYYGEEPFLAHAAPTYVLDGTGDSDITGVKVDVTLGVEELQSQGLTLDEMPVQNRTIDVEVTRRFESPAHWKSVYYGGGVAPTTTVATGSLRVGALAGPSYLIDMNLPVLTYRGNALTELDPDGKTVIETLSARSVRAASSPLWISVQNLHASVYGS